MRLPIRSWKNTLGKLGHKVREVPKRQRLRHPFSVETLETRVAMTVNSNFASGLLTVTGDGADDTITIGSVNVGGTDYLTVNGSQVGSTTAAAVTAISVDGGSGHDTIDLSAVLPAKFTGLASGSIDIFGGNGNDTITGSPLGEMIDGGAGNDVIDAGDGDDDLLGQDGDDDLYGGGGNDTLQGGGGSDSFDGGSGNNEIVDGSATQFRIGLGLANTVPAPDTQFPQSETVRSLTNSFVEASDWVQAVERSVNDLGMDVDDLWDGDPSILHYNWADERWRFHVGTYDDLSGEIPGFGIPSMAADTKLIVFEDWTDGDYDETYWVINVEEKGGSGGGGKDEVCPCECAGAGVDSLGNVSTGSGGMFYNSGVNPHPIVRVNAPLPVDQMTEPDSIEAELILGGVSSGTVYYDPAGYDPGDEMMYALQVDASTLPTGRYSWTMELTYRYGGTSVVRTYEGKENVVNRASSEFGKGWFLDELDQLHADAHGVLLVTGTNHSYYFVETSGGYVAETGAYSAAELVKNIDDSYTLTMPDGSKQEFDENGLLVARVDRLGNETTYAYDDEDGDTVADELVEIEDWVGRTTTLVYTSGLMTSKTDFAGEVTTYAYTGGRLTSMTAPDPDDGGPLSSPVTEYEYDGTTGLLELIRDPNDLETEITYDHARRVTELALACGGTTELSTIDSQAVVDLNVHGSSAMNPAPSVATENVVEYSEDAGGKVRYVVRDANGRMIQETDGEGVVIQYERDLDGRVTKQTRLDPDGVGPLSKAITTYTYDSRGNLTQQVNPDGSEESWTYDATFSQVTSYTDPLDRVTWYDIDPVTGDVLGTTQVVGDDDRSSMETDDITTTYTYTDGTGVAPAGLVETETDPLGHVTTYTYISRGLVETVTYADGTVDEYTVSYEYDARDNTDAKVDGLGRRTEFTYDNLDRMIQKIEVDPDVMGPLTSPIWNFTYDANGNRTHVSDPWANVTEYVYDERNRVAEMIEEDPDGAGPQTSPVTYYTYLCKRQPRGIGICRGVAGDFRYALAV